MGVKIRRIYDVQCDKCGKTDTLKAEPHVFNWHAVNVTTRDNNTNKTILSGRLAFLCPECLKEFDKVLYEFFNFNKND